MDLTAIEDALVALEPDAMETDDARVRQAASRAMAALLSYIDLVTDGQEVVMEWHEIAADSTLPHVHDMGDRFGHLPNAKRPSHS